MFINLSKYFCMYLLFIIDLPETIFKNFNRSNIEFRPNFHDANYENRRDQQNISYDNRRPYENNQSDGQLKVHQDYQRESLND